MARRAIVDRCVKRLIDARAGYPEPLGDGRARHARVGELLLELQRQEQTMLIVVTHSERLAGLMERRLELDDGNLREMAKPE